jgi:N-acetylglucosamine malate deacetylase 1
MRIRIIVLLAAVVATTPTNLSRAADPSATNAGNAAARNEPKKLRVVFLGAHCDDNEIGAGGLMRILANQGHEVISAYGTTFRQGRTCDGKPEDEVRRAEAAAACKVLGATPHFFPYAHEDLEKPLADSKTLSEMGAWLKQVKPDIVLTHWPIDAHSNHCSIAEAVIAAYCHSGPGWNLYFYENITFAKWEELGSLGFRPTLYVDIEKVHATKKQAVAVFRSQAHYNLWDLHDNMHVQRGKECGAKYAEAFFLVEAKPGCPLLPLSFRPIAHQATLHPDVYPRVAAP